MIVQTDAEHLVCTPQGLENNQTGLPHFANAFESNWRGLVGLEIHDLMWIADVRS